MNYPSIEFFSVEVDEYFSGEAKVDIAVHFDKDTSVNFQLHVYCNWNNNQDEIEIDCFHITNEYTESDNKYIEKAKEFIKKNISCSQLSELILNKIL